MRLATNKHKPFSILTGVLLLSATAVSFAQAGTQRSVHDLTASPPASEQPTSYRALLIGNSKYQFLSPLETPTPDVTAIARLLRERYGFETEVLLDATRTEILDAMVRYRKSLTKDTNFLVFYAGHGYLDSEADQSYWLPVDARSDNNTNWISTDEITQRIRPLASNHVLVISDSCYSGAILVDGSAAHRGLREIGGGVPTEYAAYLSKMQQLTSRDWMASGSSEPVEDGGAPGHSIFAGAFLQGLQDTTDVQFSADDLFQSYVRRRVAGISRQLPQYGSIRESGDQLGDFVFARAGKISSSIATAPKPSSDGGRGHAWALVGTGYADGGGFVAQDDVKAVRLFRKAADDGDGLGMAWLGKMYEQGRGGLAKDDAQAVYWYRKAVDAGYAPAAADVKRLSQ